MITKADMLKALEALEDDDVILIKCDGGSYWGDYLDVPEMRIVEVANGMADDHFVGHPGGRVNVNALTNGKKVMILQVN